MRVRPPWVALSVLIWVATLGPRGTGTGRMMVSVDSRGVSSVSVADSGSEEGWVHAGGTSGLCSCATWACFAGGDWTTAGLISSMTTMGMSDARSVPTMSMWIWLCFADSTSSTACLPGVSDMSIEIDRAGPVGGCDRGLTGMIGGCRGLE